MIPKSLNQVELKKVAQNVTSRAGLSWIQSGLKHMGFFEKIDKLKPCESTSNRALPMSIKLGSEVLSRIAGACAIEDIEVLRKDEGLRRITGAHIVSGDTIRNMLLEEETVTCQKEVNRWMVVKALTSSKEKAFTYDNDATYCESAKESASYSYRDTHDHSALLGFIVELGLCATMDFRTGSVSPKDGILGQIKEVIAMASAAGKRIARVRLDSAGHSDGVFQLCQRKAILFYITLAQNVAVKEIIRQIDKQQWQPLEGTNREYAESVYAPQKGSALRMVVLRWPKEQGELFGESYGYHVVGTSDEESEALRVVEIHNGRMGSENYNKELKDGYNCDWSPSHNFLMNANYFYAGIVAYNCVEMVKRFYIRCEEVARYRIKRFRHWFVNISGKLVKTGRKYYYHVINAPDKSYAMIHSVWCRLQYDW